MVYIWSFKFIRLSLHHIQLQSQKSPMENYSKKFYVLPDTANAIWSIIKTVHAVDHVSPKGTIIPAKKKLALMYPKYIYIIHYLVKEYRQNTREYTEYGVGISTSYMKKRIAEDGPTVGLMLAKLIEYGIIDRVKKYSNGRRRIAAKYRLTKSYEMKVCEAEQQIFTREEHGIFIKTQVIMDTKFKQALAAYEAEYGDQKIEPVQLHTVHSMVLNGVVIASQVQPVIAEVSAVNQAGATELTTPGPLKHKAKKDDVFGILNDMVFDVEGAFFFMDEEVETGLRLALMNHPKLTLENKVIFNEWVADYMNTAYQEEKAAFIRWNEEQIKSDCSSGNVRDDQKQ